MIKKKRRKKQRAKVKSVKAIIRDSAIRSRSFQICIWLAEYRSDSEIVTLLTQHFNYTVTRQYIWKFAQAKRWKKVIQYIRIRIFRKAAETPIRNENARYRMLQRVFEQAMTESLKTITSDGVEIYELKLGAAIQAVKEAREESKGKLVLGDNNKLFFGDINIKEITYEKAVGEVNKRLLSQWD